MSNDKAPADVLHLDPAEYTFEELHDILAGRSQRLPPVAALTVLRQKRYPEAQKVADLQRILLDEGASSRLRTAAAVELGRLGTPAAHQALAAQRTSDSPLINRAASLGIRELEQVHGRAQLEALEQVAAPVGRPALAETMTRPAGQILTITAEQAQAITHRKSPKDMAAQIVTDLVAEQPDLTLRPDSARTLRCAGQTLAFVAEAAMERLIAEPEAAAGPTVAGVVAVKESVESGKWSTRFFLMAGPGEGPGELALRLATGQGRVVMTGTTTLEEGRADFELRSVHGPGNAPAELIGSYRDGRLRLTEGRSQPRIVEQQRPASRG